MWIKRNQQRLVKHVGCANREEPVSYLPKAWRPRKQV